MTMLSELRESKQATDKPRRRSALGAAAVKIMIVDSHALVRQSLAVLLRDLFPRAAIVEAADPGEALAEARRNADCRLILFDLESAGGAGPAAVRELVLRLPRAAIAVLSATASASEIVDALHAGARGFIVKTMTSRVLGPALQLMLAGETFISSGALRALADAIPGVPEPPRRSATAIPTLTARQTEILTLLAQGLANRDIAGRLGMLEGTVKVHVKAILHKLGVRNRTHAVVTGLRLGLIPVEAVFSEHPG